MKISNNFTLEELYKSYTADSLKIDNKPNEKMKNNLIILVKEVLQPIRDAFGQPIIVSSGYRCSKLNKAVGGAANSDHLYGSAADIHTKSDKPEDNKVLFDTICMLAKTKKIKCRQIIDEYGYNWVHVSINNEYNSKKDNQILHIK